MLIPAYLRHLQKKIIESSNRALSQCIGPVSGGQPSISPGHGNSSRWWLTIDEVGSKSVLMLSVHRTVFCMMPVHLSLGFNHCDAGFSFSLQTNKNFCILGHCVGLSGRVT